MAGRLTSGVRQDEHDMINKDTKVLGYIAVQPGTTNVLCDGDSCIVAGSETLMEEYIAAFSGSRRAGHCTSKARYGHVIQAMKLGGIYSFDRESFTRFQPLARKDGMELIDFTPEDRSKPEGPAISLMRVQWKSK